MEALSEIENDHFSGPSVLTDSGKATVDGVTGGKARRGQKVALGRAASEWPRQDLNSADPLGPVSVAISPFSLLSGDIFVNHSLIARVLSVSGVFSGSTTGSLLPGSTQAQGQHSPLWFRKFS